MAFHIDIPVGLNVQVTLVLYSGHYFGANVEVTSNVADLFGA